MLLFVTLSLQGGMARFINHSCDPNCYTKIIGVDGVRHIFIYSKRAIAPGEELSYDYKVPQNPQLHLWMPWTSSLLTAASADPHHEAAAMHVPYTD